MPFVIDASVILAAMLPDEQSERAVAILARGIEEQVQAPQLLLLEVTNALKTSIRRKRLSEREAALILEQFTALPIEYASVEAALIESIFQIALRFDLSIYDASYLDLAKRHAISLASFDAKLCSAAKSMKITLL